MKRKKAGRNSGSAIVVAVAIMMLVMMMSFALLLACGSLRQNAVRQNTMEQCKEIAQTVSKELEAEITHDFASAEEVMAEVNAQDAGCPLWAYLRCGIRQASWPYYNEEELRHQEQDAWRTFTLDYGTAAGKAPGTVTATMYWEGESEDDMEEDAAIPFFIQVTCQIGKLKSTITSEYELTIEENDPNYLSGEAVRPTGAANVDRNEIRPGEKWTFHFVERK